MVAVLPHYDAFSAASHASGRSLLYLQVSSDTITPVAAFLRLAQREPYACLFESVEGGSHRGRYSILALDPDRLFRCEDHTVTVCDGTGAQIAAYTGDVFSHFREFAADAQCDIPENLPPMVAGIFGYMAYDMVRHMEHIATRHPRSMTFPDALYIRPRLVMVFDHVRDVLTLATTTQSSDKHAYDEACAYLQSQLQRVFITSLQEGLIPATKHVEPLAFSSTLSREAYHAIVQRAKSYITAGDIFQVVPSRRLSAPFVHDAFALYRALRRLNPSPYLFFVQTPDGSLVGSSPEILVRVQHGQVAIRPIAGTRKRGATPEEDLALECDLLSDPKEVAEHLMLLDLGRHDVGRVAAGGTVRVTERMVIERYSHVMHIVSHVEGRLADDKDMFDALISGFPAGTVSGAPKIRAMQIIDELESERRHFYGGTVGYFSADGCSMDHCIALRTGLVHGGMLYAQSGGGVVADSDPEAEFQETVKKAGALVQAAQEASRYAS
jgi:anthranilate synthase component I